MAKSFFQKKARITLIALAILGLLIATYDLWGFFFKEIAILHSTNLRQQLLVEKLPRHVAIMMDGNGRWAIQQGKPRVFGHQQSLQSVEEAIAGCVELNIPYLTLYAFSTENWQRPREEIHLLMQLFTTTVQTKLPEFIKNDIKLTAIGDLDQLPSDCQAALNEAVKTTQNNKGLHLVVALSYSGRWDILQAAKKVAHDVWAHKLHPEDITPTLFQTYLATHAVPDPDLLIRTGGDMRISNFLLWQLAYTELVVLKKYWPEFRKEDLYASLLAYQQRDRRFGKVS